MVRQGSHIPCTVILFGPGSSILGAIAKLTVVTLSTFDALMGSLAALAVPSPRLCVFGTHIEDDMALMWGLWLTKGVIVWYDRHDLLSLVRPNLCAADCDASTGTAPVKGCRRPRIFLRQGFPREQTRESFLGGRSVGSVGRCCVFLNRGCADGVVVGVVVEVVVGIGGGLGRGRRVRRFVLVVAHASTQSR